MKTIFQHPPEPANGKKYWRSLDQFAETPEFNHWLEREFPQGASEFNGDGVSRRNFLKLMGASTALAGVGLSACRRPELHLVPFTKSVEWAIPGKPLFFATSMPERRGYIPLILATHDGRPTKVEGNPLHPVSNGGTDGFAQASILDLYDPDRSRFFLTGGAQSDAAKFDAYLDGLLAGFKSNEGEGIAFLVGENNSPTRERLRWEIAKKYPKALWSVYEPLGGESAAQADAAAFGEGVQVRPLIGKADVILAIDSDFLGCGDGGVDSVRAFTSRRRVSEPGAKMNRLYVVENHYTVTGGMSDHRLRIPASHIPAFTQQLAESVAVLTGDPTLRALCDALPKSDAKFTEGWIEETVNDLFAARGKSLVLVGGRQPAAVQLLGHAINAALRTLGKTVVAQAAPTQPGISIQELAKSIRDKKVAALFILGGNPVYNAPSELDWAALQKSVSDVIRLGMYEDETSRLAKWQVPAAHYLEAWGDGRSADGSYVSVQPMVLPLYGGWSEVDLLARVAGLPKPQGPELVQETFRGIAKPGDFDAAWNKFLHDGFLADSSAAPITPTLDATAATAFLKDHAAPQALAGDQQFEVVFIPDNKVYDGRYANNGWLQEMPDPVTRLTWDNAALMSLATAKKLGIVNINVEYTADTIEITLGDKRKIEIAALVAPGHADHSISLPLGYGRAMAGRVCAGAGVNVYPLRTSDQSGFAVGAAVKRTGKTYSIAITQQHHSMEGRALVREGTVEQFKEKPDFAQTMWMDAELPTKNPSLYTHPTLDGIHQWGMVVDLNTCTGCNACVIACQAENNTPIVGKDQVISGREMHWMRIDRYFASEDANDPNPEMVTQPLMCQQCENAPCETVCPVNATVHTEDGLNAMAYNRCIGTRYCANNCPFKVRRFNFFDYNQRPIENHQLYLGPLTKKGTPDTIKMQKNPNVTVRMRGVMEKCTFCVQRIQEAKIAAKVHAGASADVQVPTDVFKSACQQSCPAEAITFGNIKDPESKVAKLKKEDPRNYRLLAYLNVEPRVSYLARIRNPNMKMPDAKNVGTFEIEPKHEPAGGAS
jgi:molybdopterin-containing oxidoreductase family iron-sulfur binding subunit